MISPRLRLAALALGCCIARAETHAGDSLSFHGGVSGIFDNEKNPTLAVEYRFSERIIGLNPWLGCGWATDGAVFLGSGLSFSHELAPRRTLTLGFGPGYYERHEGEDLGSNLEFYSFAELSYELREGRAVFLRFGHISNGGLAERNPGAELLTLGYRFKLP